MEKNYKESLIVDFDLTKKGTWLEDPSDLTLTSLIKARKYKEHDLTQGGYCKNMVDAGVDETDHTITNELKLYQVNPENLDITPVTAVTGDYFIFSGGSLTGNFKFEGTDFEMIPERFRKGFTIEVRVLVNEYTFGEINEGNDGIFLYLGARSENPLAPTSGMSEDVNGNMIAFLFNSEGQIGYKTIDDNGLITELYSDKSIKSCGWKVINITYIPCEEIIEEIIHCTPRRGGEFTISVNGLPYLDNQPFEEPIFRGFNDLSGTTEGLPYAITLGGGTFGLRQYTEVVETNVCTVVTGVTSGISQTEVCSIISGETESGITETEVCEIVTGVTETVTEEEICNLVSGYSETNKFGDFGIGKHFGGSFYGGIQSLKIWDRSMYFDEVINSYNTQAVALGLHKLEGGRVIRYEQ